MKLPIATPNRGGLPEVLQFMQVLWAVAHGLNRTSKRMNALFGVTGPQRLVLRVVGLFPGLSARELAATLHVHPSTLTGVLQRLVAHELLLRVGDPHDRRRAILRLTARGRRVNNRRHDTVEAAIAAALVRVTDADQRATQRVLAHLAAALCVPGGTVSVSSGSGRERRGPRMPR
jgi:DNA-binding MarR family transcriptional regulator